MATTGQSPRGRPRWLRVLHRVGYVTTALVLLEILFVAFLATRGWLHERQIRSAQIEDSRTHEGPLRAADDDIVRAGATYLFAQLPPLAALHGDGLRFLAMPSFNRSHFAVVIYLPKPDAKEAEGVLSRFDSQNNYAPLGKRRFRLPVSTYRSLATKMDKLTDDWPGDSGFCLDGTPTAFERVRGRRVTSGIGNCDQHYEQVGSLMWNYLQQFAPGEDVPSRGDWEPAEKR
jgi:hypothetical protein